MEYPKYCKVCGQELIVSESGKIERGYNEFTGEKVPDFQEYKAECPVLEGCGEWTSEMREEAKSKGLYSHTSTYYQVEEFQISEDLILG